MIKKKSASEARLRRHRRVRKKVAGTAARPRLCVFRSQNQIYAQLIDDERMTTLASASSREAEAGQKRDTAKPATARRRGATSAVEQAPAAAEPPAVDTSAIPEGIANNRRVVQARAVGRLIAQRARTQGIQHVVFDRGGYLYHGRVAALATGAREGGLEF